MAVMAEKVKTSKPLPIVALALAWLVPGAGHAYIGRRRRGIIIFVTIGATFWAGVGLGGVMTVDHRIEPWWFMAEMLAGAHGLLGWSRQKAIYRKLADEPEIGPLVSPRSSMFMPQQMQIDGRLKEMNLVLVYPVDTIARAYAGVAGMLNLLCIFDATILAIAGVTGEPPLQERKKQTGGDER